MEKVLKFIKLALIVLGIVLTLSTIGNFNQSYDKSIRLRAMEKWVDCHIEYERLKINPGNYCSNLLDFNK